MTVEGTQDGPTKCLAEPQDGNQQPDRRERPATISKAGRAGVDDKGSDMRSANGGPAFPVPGLQHDEDFNGMTLRDYFAAEAMKSMDLQDRMADDIARDAYWIADAMLAERAK